MIYSVGITAGPDDQSECSKFLILLVGLARGYYCEPRAAAADGEEKVRESTLSTL